MKIKNSSTCQIMLVHGSKQNASELASILTPHYQVTCCPSVSAAISSTADLPDLLLIDSALDKSHIEELNINCSAAKIPCLLYGANWPSNSKDKYLAEGINGFLALTSSPEDIRYRVSSTLTIDQLTRERDRAIKMRLEQSQIQDESLKSAAHIQKCLVPPAAPKIPNLKFGWNFLPCHKVGGDLFYVSRLDEHTLMAYIIDVTGHGFSSAMVTVSVSQFLSPYIGSTLKAPLDTPPYYHIVPPGKVLEILNKEYPFERFDMFFTISYILLDLKTGRLTYSSAGHPAPIVVRENGQLEALEEGGPIIGLDESVFEEGVTCLKPGDRVFLYTDGIIEHFNGEMEMFGADRFHHSLCSGINHPIDQNCENVILAVESFGKGTSLGDDITILGIEYSSNGG